MSSRAAAQLTVVPTSFKFVRLFTVPRCLSARCTLTRSTLDLSNNCIEGRLPSLVSRLTRLQRLFLDNNHFSGELRVSYSRLERLV